MRTLCIALLLAAACGSKSPEPAAPSNAAGPEEEKTGERTEQEILEEIQSGNYQPAECDDFCATGCNEVEDYQGCMADCGCADGQDEPQDEE